MHRVIDTVASLLRKDNKPTRVILLNEEGRMIADIFRFPNDSQCTMLTDDLRAAVDTLYKPKDAIVQLENEGLTPLGKPNTYGITLPVK